MQNGSLSQWFSVSATLLGAGTAILCIVGCLAASWALPTRCQKQYKKYSQTLTNILLGAILSQFGKYWYRQCSISTQVWTYWKSLEHYNDYFGRRAQEKKIKKNLKKSLIFIVLAKFLGCWFRGWSVDSLFTLNVCAVCWPETISLYTQGVENLFNLLSFTF